jgi:hypothetical protein
MKGKIGVYAVVPVALMQDDRLKASDIRVYAALASYQGQDEDCWPSRESIAERAGIKGTPESIQAQVSKTTRRLEIFGWIKKLGLQGGKSNHYTVLVDITEELPVTRELPTRNPGVTPPVTRELPNYSHENQQGKGEENKSAKIKPEKIAVGTFKNMFMTREQIEKISQHFPMDHTERIDKISEWLEQHGKRNKNDYAAVLCWARRDGWKPSGGRV